MKIRIIPRAQRNDFNLSWSTSYSSGKTLIEIKTLDTLKHWTQRATKMIERLEGLVYEDTLAAIKLY